MRYKNRPCLYQGGSLYSILNPPKINKVGCGDVLVTILLIIFAGIMGGAILWRVISWSWKNMPEDVGTTILIIGAIIVDVGFIIYAIFLIYNDKIYTEWMDDTDWKIKPTPTPQSTFVVYQKPFKNSHLPNIVIQRGETDDGKFIYWFTDQFGARISNYYENVLLKMVRGVFLAQKNGKYVYLCWTGTAFKSITSFNLDSAEIFENRPLPTPLKDVYKKENAFLANVSVTPPRLLIYEDNSLQLYEINDDKAQQVGDTVVLNYPCLNSLPYDELVFTEETNGEK